MAHFTLSEPDYNAGTHFLDRTTISRIKGIGYAVFLPEQRVGDDDLAVLTNQFNINLNPGSFIIEPGDAIIFDAPNVMLRIAYPEISLNIS